MESIQKFNKVAQLPLTLEDLFEIQRIQKDSTNNAKLFRLSNNRGLLITHRGTIIHIFEYVQINDSVVIFGKSDIYAENTLTCTTRINNYVEGLCTIYRLKEDGNTEVAEVANYHFSKLNGPRVLTVGEFTEITTYVMNVKHGRYVVQLTENNRIMAEGNYSYDNKSGRWTSYYANGEVKEIKTYDGATGKLEGKNILFKDNKPVFSKFFLQDKLHGEICENDKLSYFIFGNQVTKEIFDQYPFEKEKEIFGW